tara:strand:+ start:16905 stop:17954 length:1050 start_codon:yes stop_codon:yes gene_type:complete
MNFKNLNINKFSREKGVLIDVRSPDEYYKGHMPNSINIPLFSNDERAFIGKKYKNAGRKKAVIEGLKIVEGKFDNLVNELINVEEKYFAIPENALLNPKYIKIYCARGGMRSHSISWLLNKFKYKTIKLDGGYKSYRNSVLNNFNEKRGIIVIGGKTGTGKTNILFTLKKMNYQIIDFEALANHRGSSFGGLGMGEQPTNEQFENLIYQELESFDNSKPIFVEAESANIGKCRIPNGLFNQMQTAKRIEIVKDDRERINELIKTYSNYPKDSLKESVLRITKRLGPQRTKKALEAIDQEKWSEVCEAVLEYYDKCYDYELKSKQNVVTLRFFKNEEDLLKSILKNSEIF